MVPKSEPITDLLKAVRCKDCLHYQIVPHPDGTMRPTCTGAMH